MAADGIQTIRETRLAADEVRRHRAGAAFPKIDWVRVARLVLLARELDRHEREQLTPDGKVLLQFSTEGHELYQVLLALALTHPHDGATAYYRSRPFLLASGLTLREALAAGMGRTGGPSEGRDTGVLLSVTGRGGATVLPPSGDVGAQYTPAVGWAQAIQYRRDVLGETEWAGAVAAACGGDASVATNGFWAALNVATTLRLPVIFAIEDNGYGISVPSTVQTPGGNIASNLGAFEGLEILDLDGSDPIETWNGVHRAVQHARRGDGPCLLRVRVPRIRGHAISDKQHYRSDVELEDARERDPVRNLQALLEAQGVTPEAFEALRAEVRQEVEETSEVAEALAEPSTSDPERHLFFSESLPLCGGLRREGALPPLGPSSPAPEGPRINVMDAMRRALASELETNPRAVLFGEDVGRMGGVHRVTEGLQRQFGELRVFDTSLSEEAIVGRSLGMAAAGLLPLPEVQFRKYADAAHEQIVDIGTLRWRSAGRFAAPTVIRLPLGPSRRCGDPYHAVCGEAVYAHALGWHIAYPSNAEDAVGLFRTACRSGEPTLFLEHRFLLDAASARRPYPGDDFCLPFGKAAVLVEGGDLTTVTWGAMVDKCIEAAEAFPGRVTVLDLRTICPWDREAVLESVRATGRAIVVHEDTLTAGFAGEILATIAREAFFHLEAPLERVATLDCPVPYNLALMDQVIPNVERIRTTMREVLEA